VKPCHPEFAKDLMAAWLDYEEGRTPEGRWVRQMDKFECLTQAFEYEQRTHGTADLEEFQGLSSKITSPEGQDWLTSLGHERSEHFLKRGRRLPVVFIAGMIIISTISLIGADFERQETQVLLRSTALFWPTGLVFNTHP
jgi:putative hydrolases of HD superfamily